MAELLVPFIVIALIAVILIMGAMLYTVIEQAHSQQEKLITGLLSRNATDYAIATKIEKEVVPEKPNPDEVPLTEATDEEFARHIEQVVEEE